jgi:class I fructose-bisphosphate aldolase
LRERCSRCAPSCRSTDTASAGCGIIGRTIHLASATTKFGKTSPIVYERLTSDNPIDWCRWQVANCYMGRIGLINSGGVSKGQSDFAEAVRTAVINKRAGGMGLISGRKAFQRPMAEGIKLLNLIQDVYLDPQVTVA